MPAEPPNLREIYDDLGGVAEVAAMLGVPKSRVNRWIERRDATSCPQPVRNLICGHVYSLADWRAWYALWKVTRGCETWYTDRVPNGFRL